MKGPLISVIMPVYNNERYLLDAVKSILNQTYSNFELIITDDCSTDNSLRIIEDCALLDSRIKVIRNKTNLGLIKSLNNMINESNGDIIARMDGDDISFVNRLERQLNILQNDNVDFVFSNTELIDFNGSYICLSYRPKIETILKVIHIHNYIPHPSVIFKKKLIENYGNYCESAMNCEDQELWIRFKNNNVSFYFLNEPLIYYRINPNSVRKTTSSKYYKIASLCIINKNRLKAFKYFKYLNSKEKILTMVKMILPRETMYLRQLFHK